MKGVIYEMIWQVGYIKFEICLWWLNLCVNLTGPQAARMFGQILLGVSLVRVFLDDINIWMGRLNKADCSP